MTFPPPQVSHTRAVVVQSLECCMMYAAYIIQQSILIGGMLVLYWRIKCNHGVLSEESDSALYSIGMYMAGARRYYITLALLDGSLFA